MSTVTPVIDPKLKEFIAASDEISKGYQLMFEGWAGSKFQWLTTLPSRSKGAAAEKIIEYYLKTQGFSVARAKSSEFDRVINGVNVEIKFSTRWQSGEYVFQQIRQQDYAGVFCLGIAPQNVQAWYIPKAVMMQHATAQHGGKAGKDTKWLVFSADNPPAWLSKYGGALSLALEVLRSHPTA